MPAGIGDPGSLARPRPRIRAAPPTLASAAPVFSIRARSSRPVQNSLRPTFFSAPQARTGFMLAASAHPADAARNPRLCINIGELKSFDLRCTRASRCWKRRGSTEGKRQKGKKSSGGARMLLLLPTKPVSGMFLTACLRPAPRPRP